MISDDFALELYNKLHPGSEANCIDEVTETEKDELLEIVNTKHLIELRSSELPGETIIDVDMGVLKHLMTTASLACMNELSTLNDTPISTFADPARPGRLDGDQINKWKHDIEYYEDQLTAVKEIEGLIERLRQETHKPDFYTRGVI
jgi:hypothetical protein